MTEIGYINVSSTGIVGFVLEEDNVKVYPNPNDGVFNIVFNLKSKENVRIKIFNMQGQLLSHEYTNKISGIINKRIDLSGYNGGIYHLQVITDNNTVNKKIVIR